MNLESSLDQYHNGRTYREKVKFIKERVAGAIVVQQRISSGTEMGKQAQAQNECGENVHCSRVLYRSRSKGTIGRSLSKTSSPM